MSPQVDMETPKIKSIKSLNKCALIIYVLVIVIDLQTRLSEANFLKYIKSF